MSRATLILILIVAAVVGAVVILSSLDTEVPQTRVEKPLANEVSAQ